MDLLHRINLKGTTVLIATHNAIVVDRMRRRVIRLENGKIVADEERGYYLAAGGDRGTAAAEETRAGTEPQWTRDESAFF
jgi:ABC-type multidrug transport system ATPase subunit